MNTLDRIKLIDDMIKENPDYTIRDYLEAFEEIMAVEEVSEKPIIKEMPKEKKKISFIEANINRDSRGRFIRRDTQKIAS